uniref:Sushi, von Willebrand factor type A, EGF and pentraxin domain-containing protein 1 n=1 Tax=Trichogramma kaykai TaxID=54128 RepID=A0ABD2WLF1_9HYME
MQSSKADSGIPQLAVDASSAQAYNPQTCTLTLPEEKPWWYVNLLEPYMVQLVRLDFGKSCCGDGVPGTIVVRVGNNRPDLGTNPVCNRFTGPLEEGSPLFLPCNPPMPGAFVSVHLESTKPKQPVQLSLCEAFVYTDQALPIERCPQFRDQPPGSTATYNGKCYIFYNRQPRNFRDALDFCRDRGGSLVDESNPALQGFISWELWRRHRSDTSSQYWMGAVRDPKDRSVWRWTGSGDEISVSFWSIPQGTEQDCARYDGSRGWLWSDTPCNARLNYICQHQPRACGRPEQPPNSTMSVVGPNAGNKSLLDSSRRYQVGTNVEYSCDTGSLLIGPSTRTCLDTGFYNEFPPVCKSIECGYPANIKHGGYTLINDTVTYLSQVLYSCEEGFEMTGRARLTCDIDERWNGPPPRCEPIRCDAPAVVPHASLAIEEIDIEDIGSAGKSSSAALLSQGQAAKSLFVGSIVTYTCEKGYKLIGNRQLLCLTSGSYDRAAPTCIEDSQREQSPTPSSPATTKPSSSKPSATRGRPFLPTRTRSTTTTQAPTSPSGSTSRSTTSTMTTTTTTTNQPPIQRVYHTTTRTRPQLPTTPSLVGSELPASVKETEQKRPSIGLQRPVETKRPPVHETADHPQDNEISGSGVDNAHAEIGAGVPEPNGPYRINRADQPTSHQAKLNMTMIIGVAIFGAVVFLAVIITTTILVMKKYCFNSSKHYRHRASPDCNTVASFDSGSSGSRGGLNRYYRQAWENLHESTGQKMPVGGGGSVLVGPPMSSRRRETLDEPGYRDGSGGHNNYRHHGQHNNSSSVERDGSELVVNDAYASKNVSGDKKRHHHHHHHHYPINRDHQAHF